MTTDNKQWTLPITFNIFISLIGADQSFLTVLTNYSTTVCFILSLHSLFLSHILRPNTVEFFLILTNASSRMVIFRNLWAVL